MQKTLLAGIFATIHATCPSEIWRFAINQGIQLLPEQDSIPFQQNFARNEAPRILKQAPVRLVFRIHPSGAPLWPDLVELSIEAETHATLGYARLAAPCETWRAFAEPTGISAARQYLLRQLNRRWRYQSHLYQENNHEPQSPLDTLHRNLDSIPP